MTQFEKTFHFMKKPWVITLYAVLVVLCYLYVDKNLATYFHDLDLRTHVRGLKVLTAFGFWMAYLALFFATGLFFRYVKPSARYEKYSWYLFACVFVANLVCFVAKVSLSRARPDLLFTSNEFGFYWFKLKGIYWSFPSGHTTTVVSLAAGLGILFPRYFYLAIIAALLIAASRVLLYYHYLSDVITAFYLSVLVVGYLTHFLRKKGW